MIIFITLYIISLIINLRLTKKFHNNIYYDQFEGIGTVGFAFFSFIPIFPAIYILYSLNALSKLEIEDLRDTDEYKDYYFKEGFNFLDNERMHCCYVKDNKLYKFAMYPDIRAKNSQKVFNKQMLILKNLNRTFTIVENSYIEEDTSRNMKEDV